MAPIYGYIRTSRRLQEGVPEMDPESQELQPRRVCVPRDNICRDVGVSGATGSTAGDTLAVVVLIDRIGRRWPDTIRSICELRDRGVKVRSLETDPGTSEVFFGQILTMLASPAETAAVGTELRE